MMKVKMWNRFDLKKVGTNLRKFIDAAKDSDSDAKNKFRFCIVSALSMVSVLSS